MTLETHLLPPHPFTGSVFRRLEELLEDEEYRCGLERVACRKKAIEKYVDWIDFLYAEIFRHLFDARRTCLNFYEGKAQPLETTVGGPDIRNREQVLLIAVKMARLCMDRDVRPLWKDFRATVIDFAEQKNML